MDSSRSVPAGAAAFTVSDAVFVMPSSAAVIVTTVFEATEAVEIGNDLSIVPPATTTLDGTVAAAVLLLLSDTTFPDAGAGRLRCTAPLDAVPPVTVEGSTITELSNARYVIRRT
jgi:hypothetical protein